MNNQPKTFEEILERSNEIAEDPKVQKMFTLFEFRLGQLALLKSNLGPIYKLTIVLMMERVKNNRMRRIEKEIDQREESATIGFSSEDNSGSTKAFKNVKVLGFRA